MKSKRHKKIKKKREGVCLYQVHIFLDELFSINFNVRTCWCCGNDIISRILGQKSETCSIVIILFIKIWEGHGHTALCHSSHRRLQIKNYAHWDDILCHGHGGQEKGEKTEEPFPVSHRCRNNGQCKLMTEGFSGEELYEKGEECRDREVFAIKQAAENWLTRLQFHLNGI